MADNEKNTKGAKPGKKKNRRAYLDDFRQDESGRYVYTGSLYVYNTQSPTRRQALTRLWALTAAAAAAVVVPGLLPDTVPSGFYVAPLYACGLVALISVCWALAQLTAAGDPVREYVYRKTVEKLPLRVTLTAIFSCMAAAGRAVYLVLHRGQDLIGPALLFILLEIAAAAAMWEAKKTLSVLRWRTNL